MAINDLTKLPKFQMPANLIDQLYELSGSADKYKGVVLAYLSEDGYPLIYSKYDSQIVEFGMRKVLEKYLNNSDEEEFLSNNEDMGEDGLDEDDD